MQSMSPCSDFPSRQRSGFLLLQNMDFLFSFPIISFQLMTSKFYTCVTTGLKMVESICPRNLLTSADQTCLYTGNKALHRGLTQTGKGGHESCVKPKTWWTQREPGDPIICAGEEREGVNEPVLTDPWQHLYSSAAFS